MRALLVFLALLALPSAAEAQVGTWGTGEQTAPAGGVDVMDIDLDNHGTDSVATVTVNGSPLSSADYGWQDTQDGVTIIFANELDSGDKVIVKGFGGQLDVAYDSHSWRSTSS